MRNDILDEAKSIINGQRQNAYGAPENNFERIAVMWSAYLDHAITDSDVANMMILLKVARSKHNNSHSDNWVDICGYAALGGELAARTKEEDCPDKSQKSYSYGIDITKPITLNFTTYEEQKQFTKFFETILSNNGFVTVWDILRHGYLTEMGDLSETSEENWYIITSQYKQHGWTKRKSLDDGWDLASILERPINLKVLTDTEREDINNEINE